MTVWVILEENYDGVPRVVGVFASPFGASLYEQRRHDDDPRVVLRSEAWQVAP